MENKTKEFDCQRWENGIEYAGREAESVMDEDDLGNFVRHEEHITTIQLVAEFYEKKLRSHLKMVALTDHIDLFISDYRNELQSKFTDRIWEEE